MQCTHRGERMNTRKHALILCVALCVAVACAAGSTAAAQTKNIQSAAQQKHKELSVKLHIRVNGTTLTATLYDNSSSRALVELLQKGAVTIDMHDYGNFEKVGELPVSLPRNDTPTDTDAGDIILYLGKRFVIYYDKNSWNFTPLGKVDGVTKAELKRILGAGNVTAVLSLAE